LRMTRVAPHGAAGAQALFRGEINETGQIASDNAAITLLFPRKRGLCSDESASRIKRCFGRAPA
jgi:hypothetical protein